MVGHSFATRNIEQSCSWACCPQNEITVSLVSTAPITKSCSPTLTLTGLADAIVDGLLLAPVCDEWGTYSTSDSSWNATSNQTVTSYTAYSICNKWSTDRGDIRVVDMSTSANLTGAWDAGTLTLDLRNQIVGTRKSDFHFKFTVKNPNYPISAPPTVSMTAEISPREHCKYDTAGQTFSDAMMNPIVCANRWDFAGGSVTVSEETITNTLNVEKTSGSLEIKTTKSRLSDGNALSSSCLGCCNKEVCTNVTVGKTCVNVTSYLEKTCPNEDKYMACRS